MKRSTDRILTTHVGSLPRPPDIRQMLLAKDAGQPYDADLLARRVKDEVTAVVRKQVEVGIDIVADGEISKGSFTNYMANRLSGFEEPETDPWPSPPDDFPEFAELSRQYGGAGPVGGAGLGGGSPRRPVFTPAALPQRRTSELCPGTSVRSAGRTVKNWRLTSRTSRTPSAVISTKKRLCLRLRSAKSSS